MRKIRILFITLAILSLVPICFTQSVFSKSRILDAFSIGTVFALQTSAEEKGVATLSLVPSTDNFMVGSEFEIAVILDTGGQAINVVDVIIYFPEDLIEVFGPPTRDGLLPLWQFNASNEKGEINIVGGERQNGVAASNSEITRIKFRVKKEGKAVLKISSKNSNIIAADGFGTKIPIKAGQAYYSLTTEPVMLETPEISSPVLPSQAPEEELKAMTLGLLQWGSLYTKTPIVAILKINFAGLFVALVAVIYNARKKKNVNTLS